MMKFITLLALFFAASTSLAKDKTAEPEMYMMKAEVVLKMNDQERTEYFEALREFFAANADKVPGVSQLMIDALLSRSVAQADDNEDLAKCLDGTVVRRGTVGSVVCYSAFRSAAREGRLGECTSATTSIDESTKSYYSVITCGGKTYSLPRDTARDATSQARDMNGGWVPKSKEAIAKNPQVAGTGQPPGTARPEQATNETTAPNPNDPYYNRDAGNSARCLFAGFAIAREKNKPCSPFQDLCDTNQRMRGPNSSLMREVMKCTDEKEKAKARCGGSAPAAQRRTTIRNARATTGNQVVCNPVLYGLKDDGSVICVPRGGQASQKCAAEAKDDAIKKLLQDAKGKLAFDSMLATLTFECRTHWRIENPGDVEQATVVARGGNGESRDGDKSTTDFKDTCKTLVDRVIQIGRKIPEVKGHETFKKMMSAFGNTSAAGNRPPAPGTR